MLKRLEDIVDVGECFGRREEANLSAFAAIRRADDFQRFRCETAFKAGDMFLVVAPDAQFQPFGQGVHNRDADAVQTAGYLVGIAVKLTTSVQLGHDDFSR